MTIYGGPCIFYYIARTITAARRHHFQPPPAVFCLLHLSNAVPSHWLFPTSKLRDLRDNFSGSEYRVRWHCAELIQRNVRAALSRWRVARALCAVWVKDYDHKAERFSFTHQNTGEMQYHKPWGMGTVDLWAVPGEKVDEHLVSLFLRVEVT